MLITGVRAYENRHVRQTKARQLPLKVIFVSFVATLVIASVLFTHASYYKSTAPVSPAIASSSKTPNFVFIFADDLSWNSLGNIPYDLSFATPTLTGLANKGVIMSRFYAQEICNPSRAALMTGRYPTSVGMQYSQILPNMKWGLNLTETILPQVLQRNGYKNYAFGKWNLGHYTAAYLPTARGFDEHFGYLGAAEYYWSKFTTSSSHFGIRDFMYANKSCYTLYNETDLDTYSTQLYEKKIVSTIHRHDFEAQPMFLYFASQAVHDPFADAYLGEYSDGIPSSYLEVDVYQQVISEVMGAERQQYAMALILLDNAVNSIVTALTAVGQLDNTYIIFASDNGGCAGVGGQNGPLRGTKGTLFEGEKIYNLIQFLWIIITFNCV